MDGVPASRVKEKMAELEARKATLEAKLADGEDEAVLIHPRMADYYREQVMQLRQTLSDENHRAEAAALIRRLIDRIVLTPIEHEGRKTLSINLDGQLAGILSMATKAKKPLDESGFAAESVKLVAGARNQLCLLTTANDIWTGSATTEISRGKSICESAQHVR